MSMHIYFREFHDKATSTEDLECVVPETETQVIFQTPIRDCEEQEKSVVSVSSGGSNTSLETGYEPDPDCPEGVIPQTQPCWRSGIHYTQLGLRRV